MSTHQNQDEDAMQGCEEGAVVSVSVSEQTAAENVGDIQGVTDPAQPVPSHDQATKERSLQERLIDEEQRA